MGAKYAVHAEVKIDGVPLSPAVKVLLEEIIVDDKAQVPSMFTLTFLDDERTVLADAGARIGSKIEIKTTAADESETHPLLTGEVTALEGRYGPSGARAVVRGYDLSHRLHRGRHTETYVNATDSDIAKKIAGRHGVQTGTIGSTSVTYDHVSQANMSDWDFISARAKAIGFEVTVVDGKFNFAAPTKANDASAPGSLRSMSDEDLVFGKQILEFYPRVTAGSQVKSIKVRGWDVQQKKEIIGTAQAVTVSAALALTPAKVAGEVGAKHNYVAVDRPVFNQAAANEVASALAEVIGSAFAEADGVAIGDPKIVAGKAISVGNVSDEFKGKWVVSQARHVINADGYRIYFSANGRQERSLLGLTSMAFANSTSTQGGSRMFGLVVGIVTNNDDDKHQGRVKVRFPWLADKSGDEKYESHWARVVHFGAGPDRGAFFVPEIDDEVLVGFEHGDINFPYVIGGLYNGQDKPNLGIKQKGGVDDVIAQNKVGRRGFTSRKGHALVFVDDDSDADGIVLRSSDGKLKIEIKAKGTELVITGDPKVTVEAANELTLHSKANLTIKADSNLKLEAGSAAEMKSGSSMKIQGTTVDIKGSGPTSISGAQVKLN